MERIRRPVVFVEQTDLDHDVLRQSVARETELVVELVEVGRRPRAELGGEDAAVHDGGQMASTDVANVVEAGDVEGFDELGLGTEISIGSGDLAVVAILAPGGERGRSAWRIGSEARRWLTPVRGQWPSDIWAAMEPVTSMPAR